MRDPHKPFFPINCQQIIIATFPITNLCSRIIICLSFWLLTNNIECFPSKVVAVHTIMDVQLVYQNIVLIEWVLIKLSNPYNCFSEIIIWPQLKLLVAFKTHSLVRWALLVPSQVLAFNQDFQFLFFVLILITYLSNFYRQKKAKLLFSQKNG